MYFKRALFAGRLYNPHGGGQHLTSVKVMEVYKAVPQQMHFWLITYII